MIQYKDFVFGREDDYNVNLYQYREKEVFENGGMGKGRGTATGKFQTKLEHVGHFSSVAGVVNKMLQLDLDKIGEKDNFIESVYNKIQEFENMVHSLKLKFPVEPNGEMVLEKI